jgi:hypothetical protein
MLAIDFAEAIALSPAVEAQPFVDSCSRRFVVNGVDSTWQTFPFSDTLFEVLISTLESRQ